MSFEIRRGPFLWRSRRRLAWSVGSFLLALCLSGTFAGPALARSPVAEYSFDEDEGEVVHDSSGSHDGTVSGAEWTEAGRYGSALQFNGKSDEVTVPSAEGLELRHSFTLEAWVYPTVNQPWDFILGKEDSGGGVPFGYALYGVGETANPTLALASEETEEALQSAELALPLNTWSPLAVTSNGETLTFYVDGEEDATKPAVPVKSTTGPLEIGGSELLGKYFAGKIDEVRIYDQVLTKREIAEDARIAIEPATGGVEESPEITVEGALVEAEGASPIGPEAPIDLSVHDVGGPIAQLSVSLDGEVTQAVTFAEARVEGGHQECGGEGCHFEGELVPDFRDPPQGSHTVTITATDKRGYSSHVTYAALFDTEGPEVSLAGSLAETPRVQEGETGILEVSAWDGEGAGDSGVVQIVVTVGESIVGTESFLCGPCSEPATYSYEYSAAEWGLAPHEVSVDVFDKAGNETKRVLRVNSEPQALLPHCSGGEPESMSAMPISSTEAVEALEEVVPAAVAPNVETLEGVSPSLNPTYLSSGGPSVLADENSVQGGYIEDRPGGGATIGTAGCLMPTTTTSAEAREVIPGAPVVVATDSAEEVDTFLRATPLGSALVESMRGPAAPSAYSWHVSKPSWADELVELENGAIAMLNPHGRDRSSHSVEEPQSDSADPALLNNVEAQLESALYDTSLANNSLEGEVSAVIPPPVAVDAEGNWEPVELTVGGSGDTITATPPAGTKALVLRSEAAVNPSAICAATFGANESSYDLGCLPEWQEIGQYLESPEWLSNSEILYQSYQLGGARSPLIAEPTTGGESELFVESFATVEQVDLSPNGEKIAFLGCSFDYVTCALAVANVDGSDTEVVLPVEYGENGIDIFQPSFSADEQRLMFYEVKREGSAENENVQLYSVKLDGSDRKQLTDFRHPLEPYCESSPPCSIGIRGWMKKAVATPDGKYVIVPDEYGVYRIPAASEEITHKEATILFDGSETLSNPMGVDVSPDSSKVLYSNEKGIWQVSINGTEREQILTVGGYSSGLLASDVSYSPDGTTIAFYRAGNIYAMPASGGPGSVTIVAPVTDNLTPAEAALATDPEIALATEGAEALIREYAGIAGPLEEIWELPESINEAERAFCEADLRQLKECIRFFADKDRAVDMRKRVFTAGEAFDRSTRGNAFQHAFWTALMSEDSTNTHEIEGLPFLDGFVYALLHEGPPPHTWDSQMDFINDWAGYRYFWGAAEEGQTEQQICEGLRERTNDDVFLGRGVSPFKWLKAHPAFHMHRLVYRFLKADTGLGAVVKLNGRTCARTW